MAQDTFGDFDATSSNNTTIEGDATDGAVSVAEGNLPSTINNAVRSIMAAANTSFGDLPAGAARPSYLTANRYWRDTGTANKQIIKFYDGTDDITIMTIDTSANSVTFGSGVLENVVEDTTPQLGGNLDLNGNGLTFPGATVTDVTGADTLAVSGTAGTNGNLAEWNIDGDLVDGPDVLDEDNMASDSATAVATQQSIKAYVDASGGPTLTAEVDLTNGGLDDLSTVELASGLPSGIVVIDIVIKGISLTGADEVLVQIGDSGGFEVSGYTGQVIESTTNVSFSSGFQIFTSGSAADLRDGHIFLRRLTGNDWTISGNVQVRSESQVGAFFNGNKTLSGVLDRVRITVTGTDTFDGGSASVIHQ